jgi:hypothetical protein
VISRFWEYESIEIKNAIEMPLDQELSADQILSLSHREKAAYEMLFAMSCRHKVGKYQELYNYRCGKQPISGLFRLSLKEPMVLLFTSKEDSKFVIAYLTRYLEFLKNELKLKDGMPIDVSYVEYLMSIQQFLKDVYSN